MYTILDSKGKQIKRPGIKFDEIIDLIDLAESIKSIEIGQAAPGTGSTDDNYVLNDDLTFGRNINPLPQDPWVLNKQTIKIHQTGVMVRVNCIDFEAADVHVTDITKALETTCTRNAQ